VPIIPRHLSKILERTISTSRIVNVVGPRQDGKSTLVRDLMKSAAYVTLDDTTSLRALEQDPYNQLKALSRQAPAGLPVVIDEIQRLPGLTLTLKRIVDEDNRKAHFVLTGSSDIFTSGASVDSLAGRVSTLTLRPFSTAEIFGSGPCLLLDAVAEAPQDPMLLLPPPHVYDRDKAIELMIRGGFPEMRELAAIDIPATSTASSNAICPRSMRSANRMRSAGLFPRRRQERGKNSIRGPSPANSESSLKP
jgi:uncharacterized protein